ncbi:MAG: hypothetical protein ACXAC5_03010 [Promethearchaeota archaeon]
MDDDARPFPIQADTPSYHPYAPHPKSTIPWWLAEVAYVEYVKQFDDRQSLERLADRGGFGRKELLMLIRGQKL